MTSFGLFAFCTTLKKLNTLMANLLLAPLYHRPKVLIIESSIPLAAAVVAAQCTKACCHQTCLHMSNWPMVHCLYIEIPGQD